MGSHYDLFSLWRTLPQQKINKKLGGKASDYLTKYSWQEGVRVAIEGFISE